MAGDQLGPPAEAPLLGGAILALWVPSFFSGIGVSIVFFVHAAMVADPKFAARVHGLAWWRRRARGGDSGGDAPPQPGSRGAGSAQALNTDVLAEVTGGAAAGGIGGARRLSGARGSLASSGGCCSLSEVARVELEWQALGCAYATHAGRRAVLQDVYGAAHPGEMGALMGPSGAGKSTLMDMLALRKCMGDLAGAVLVDGLPATQAFIRRTAYVPQFDNFMPLMSVAEAMAFYAGIILPGEWGAGRRAARVEEVLREMGLTHAAKTLVGGELPGGALARGLSGGERKRLSLAVGILAAPSVVFLDEPTTGLDAFAALTVMGYMKRMARDNGHIVIASIHQPRGAIWSLFDTVTLLSCGRLMYTGITDGLVEWFSSIGYGYDASLHGVVSDWALDLVACGSHKPKASFGAMLTSREEVAAASAQFLARWLDQRGVALEDLSLGGGEPRARAAGVVTHVRPARGARARLTTSGGGGGGGGALSQLAAAVTQRRRLAQIAAMASSAGASPPAAAGHPASWGAQFLWTLRREALCILRNPAEVAGRSLCNTLTAALIGLIYYGMDNSSASLRWRVNLLINQLAFFTLMPYIGMSLFSASKKFYLADQSAKLYAPSAYYLAKVAATTPCEVLNSAVFVWVAYGMAGMRNTPGAILGSGMFGTLLSLVAVQVMHLCVVVAPTQDVAFMLCIAWTSVQLLFNNFFITFGEASLQWLTNLRWLSAVYYAFEGMAVLEFSGVAHTCGGGLDAEGLAFLRELMPNTRALGLKVVQAGLASPGRGCIADASAVLGYFDFGRTSRATAAILLCYLAICHALTFAAMLLVARRERR